MKARIVYIGGKTNTYHAFFEKLNDTYDIVLFGNSFDFLSWSTKKDNITNAIVYFDHKDIFSGISFIQHLKTVEYLKNIPFILISGKLDFKIKRRLVQEGVADLIDISFDKESLRKRIDYLIANPLVDRIHKNSFDTPSHARYKVPLLKRAFDIVFSLTALIFLSPLFIIISALIAIESRGPVFYSSKRVGTGYKIFDFYKFRSMSTNAAAKLKDISHLNQYNSENAIEETENHFLCDECLKNNTSCRAILYLDEDAVCERLFFSDSDKKGSATFIKINNDPRVTRVGKFIRNTSIDELPQLVNVLIGNMSIVGNRPLPLYEAEKITTDRFASRFLAPAGITGLWQVTKRGGGGKMSEEERMELDNDYAHNYSFARDITIILKTIPALIQKENV